MKCQECHSDQLKKLKKIVTISFTSNLLLLGLGLLGA